MKPFDLELAKAGHPVQTRDGRPARIVCYDRQTKNNIYPIVAMIKSDEGNEEAQYFTQKGEAWEGEINDLDLVMAPIKKEGWVNVYKKPDNPEFYKTDCIWSSEEIAKNNINPIIGIYITSKKIEWEE